MNTAGDPPTVAIVGGGLAGLAAAEAASRCRLRVELFEAHRQLGGRAGSFRDPATGQWVDHCQHVALGCCTNFLAFCRAAGISDAFERSTALHFVGPQGTRHRLQASRWLPAPLHFGPGLLWLGYLTLRQRFEIARIMLRLARLARLAHRAPPQPAADEPTIADWLRRQGASSAAIDGFWSVVLVSALSQWPERISLGAARQVFCEGMLAARQAADVYLPRLPLCEIYDGRLKASLTARGVNIHTGLAVRRITGDASRAAALHLTDGQCRAFDFFIVAAPWHTVGRLLDDPLGRHLPQLDNLARLSPAPITAVHLWFDRPICPTRHAVLVGRTSQWVFQSRPPELHAQPPIPNPQSPIPSSYHVQVVISGSHAWSGAARHEIRDRVLAELGQVWPAARAAQLLHWRVVTRPAAVFAPLPGSDALRPGQATAVPNLLLAGDWTATGWPATMEGAVRSGYLAVERLLDRLERPKPLLAPPLARGWLARRLLGGVER